jgi:hypothetical protein
MSGIPQSAEHRRCKIAYDNAWKQRSVAWAKYYEVINEEMERARTIIQFVNPANVGNARVVLPPREELPTHITQELYEMAEKLKKKYDCPICLDMVTKETIKITFCGHIYCDTCLTALKATTNPVCGICRRKL